MYFVDHNPPHFHAEYQGQKGLFDFDGNLLRGNMKSNTAKKLIREWALLHKEELQDNWNRAAHGKQIDRIEPLN